MGTRTCAILALLAALATASPLYAAWPNDYDPRYVRAVEVSSGPLTAADVSTRLTTIGTSDHIRNASGEILMTMFTGYTKSSGATGYDRSYSAAPGRKLWVAVAPEMQDFLLDNHVAAEDVTLRSKQLLGLPQDHTGYYVVEFWTKNESLFRPAMNADITNPTTSRTFVGEMADPTNAKRIWFDDNFKTYDPAYGTPYPWTRAGYTYDWSKPWTKFGLTEFILNSNPTDILTVRSVISVNSYIYYQRATDSFHVTGWCDNIWIGSNFVPVNAGGNIVTIEPHATISGGEGITVTDLSGGAEPSNVVINNGGAIYGNASRQSSVYFTNTGGRFNNTGAVTGSDVGVLGENSTRPIIVDNRGTIAGTSYAISTSDGNDAIINSGLLSGRVSTGAGNDTVYVRGGAITGSVDGGAGNNIFNFDLPGGSIFSFFSNIDNFTNVNVNSGIALLNGQVDGTVTVAPAGTFGGNAMLWDSLINNGVVSPGNSVGTITVGGDYTQNSGGVLFIELLKTSNGSLSSDRLIVGGGATLAAGSIVDMGQDTASGGVFADGDTFQFLTAGGGITDDDVRYTIGSQFFGVTGDAGSLTLHRTASFASVASPGNNFSLASALDADAAAAVDDYAVLINGLLFTNDASTFNGLLRQYSPAAYLCTSAAANRTTQYMAESLSGYLRTRRKGRCNCWRGYDDAYAAWANPFGVFYGEETAGDHLGFQSNVAGVQLGIDKQVDRNCILGVGGGYDQMHIDTNDHFSVDTTDTFRVGPYAAWFDDAWYFDTSLTCGFHDNDAGRLLSINDEAYRAYGRYHADDLSFFAGGGRDYCVGEGILTPQASLQYIYYHQNDFTESGGRGANLVVDSLDADSLRSRVGGLWTRVFQGRRMKLLSEVFGGWAHECLGDDVLEARFLGGVTRFSTDRGGIFRDSGYYGITLMALPRDHVSLFARYNGEYSSGGHYAAIDAGLTVEF